MPDTSSCHVAELSTGITLLYLDNRVYETTDNVSLSLLENHAMKMHGGSKGVVPRILLSRWR
jgi:hypothetical protein